MKAGKLAVPNSFIRQYVAQQRAQLHTEAIVRPATDVRRTYAAFAAATLTDATAYVEDFASITPSNATGISHTAGTDNITDLDSARPFPLVLWALDDTNYGADLRMAKVSVYLDIQPNSGAAPFDGFFVLEALRLLRARGHGSGDDLWELGEAHSSVLVKASSISAAGLVDFNFASTYFGDTPASFPIDATWVPDNRLGQNDYARWNTNAGAPFFSRCVVFRLRAFLGPSGSTNYAWKYESGATNPEVVVNKGTLVYVSGATPTGAFRQYAGSSENVQVSLATGIPRMTVTVSSYNATGTVAFLASGSDTIDLGAAPTGEVEFTVLDEVPQGCTGTAYVREASPDAWVVVHDGDTASDLGLATQQTYEMKYEMAADSTLSASPRLRALGAVDRTLLDLTPFASWSDEDQSVDPRTGQVKMADAELRLSLTGQRDYRDDVTNLLSQNDWDSIEIRTHAYHPDLDRGEWGLLDLWRVDNAVVGESEAVLTCVSLLSELKGKFPRSSGTEYGYLIKSAASTLSLSGGPSAGDFQHELSQTAETPDTIVWSVTASTTEYAYLITPANVPNLKRWPSGNWTVSIPIASGNTNLKLAARLLRVNGSGALQETEPAIAYSTGEEITASTGTKTLTFGNIEWDAGASSDRLVVQLRVRNTDASDHSLTIDTGTSTSEVRPPWVPTATITPQQFNAVSPAAAYVTWRDTVVGLAARYRGPTSDRTAWLVSKAVMDADGQQEGERISYLDGLWQIASQGVIRQVHGWGPRGATVALWPMEVANGPVTMGFSERQPEFKVGFGFETTRPNDFAGWVNARHQAAYDAFGLSKIDQPDKELDSEIAKYILDAGLAGEIARARVTDMGCGFMVADRSPTWWFPHLELGDEVLLETDRIAFRDPTTNEARVGPMWARASIIGKRGQALQPTFQLWIRGLGDLFDLDNTVAGRQPYEGPKVTASIVDDPRNVQNALAVLRAQPNGATIYYYYHATGTDAPSRDRLDLWSVYSGQITLLRDTSADKLLSAFAVYNSFTGGVNDFRVAPSPASTIGTLTGTESGTDVTIVASSVGQSVRKIRWYMRKHATSYPTDDGTTTGNLDETYFVAENPTDTATGGSLSQIHTGVAYAGGDKCKVIAVPIDYNLKAGTRKTLDYAYAGATTPSLTGTWATNTTTAGAPRTIDFAWTPSSVSDVTHDLKIYANDGIKARTLIATEVSPNSTTTATAVDTGYVTGTDYPYTTLVYEYDLVAGATVITSGVFKPTDGDTFAIGDGSLAT